MRAPKMPPIDTVLFDLDGTLIDTAPDMADALITLCQEEKQQASAPLPCQQLDFARIRPHVSNGSLALVKLAFGESLKTAQLDRLKQRYLDIYAANLANHSKLFDGMTDLLAALETRHIKWGVVTNKPGWLTRPLMRALDLDQRAACIVSSDCTANRKPHPEPMFHACKLANTRPEHCLYVGDASRDIEAGRNAGMTTVAALYGYIGDREDVASWQANKHIHTPMEILTLLDE